MRHFAILGVGLCAGLLLMTQAADAGVTVSKKTIASKTKFKEIEVSYPVTGNPKIDAPLLAYAKEQSHLLDDEDENDPPPGDMKYSVDFGYTVDRNDAQMFSVSMAGEAFSGGAHGAQFMENFHFLMPDAWRVYLPELVDGQRGIDKISKLAIAMLSKQLLGKDSMTNSDWIETGAGPEARNFENFVWEKDKLVITFMPYSVAPYAMGSTDIEIPLSQIRDVIRSDPRAPSPSFACSKAKAPIEKAICSDAMLARADRQTAEAYDNRMGGAGDDKSREILRQQQRDFLFMRDKGCGVKIDCLKKAYQSRLAALKKLD